MSQSVVKLPLAATSHVDRARNPAGSRWLSAEWLYLLISALFGTAFLCLTPPFQAPDENAHFLRSLQISEGRIVSVKYGNATGDYLPASVLKFVAHFRPMRFNPETKTNRAQIMASAEYQIDEEDRVFVGFSNAAIHPPLTYLPQSLGMFLARQFSSSLLVLFYAGRCLNLVAASFLMFMAIRLTPIGKWVFTVLALTPMTVFLSATLSSDALTNGFSFLLIAYALRCAAGPEERLTRANVLYLALLGCAVGLSKQAYFLLPACYLLIPSTKLATQRSYWTGFVAVLGVTFLSVLTWGVILRGIYSPADTMVGMDPRQQLHFIITHPAEFGRALLRTVAQAPMYLQQYIGVLGWLDTRLPRWVVAAEIIVIAIIGLADTSLHLTFKQCLRAVGIATLVSATVMVIIYVTWEPVGSDIIHLQGRYFIPIGPLVVIAISGLKVAVSPFRLRSKIAGRLIAATAVPCILAATFYAAYDRYFIGDADPTSNHHSPRGQGDTNDVMEQQGDDGVTAITTFNRGQLLKTFAS